MPGTDRVERSLGFGDRLRNSDDGIVAEGVNVVLQELAELADDVFASSCLNLGLQHLVGLDDVHELGGAVILDWISLKSSIPKNGTIPHRNAPTRSNKRARTKTPIHTKLHQ